MGAIELAVILFLLLKGGGPGGILKTAVTPVPTPSTPQRGPSGNGTSISLSKC